MPPRKINRLRLIGWEGGTVDGYAAQSARSPPSRDEEDHDESNQLLPSPDPGLEQPDTASGPDVPMTDCSPPRAEPGSAASSMGSRTNSYLDISPETNDADEQDQDTDSDVEDLYDIVDEEPPSNVQHVDIFVDLEPESNSEHEHDPASESRPGSLSPCSPSISSSAESIHQPRSGIDISIHLLTLGLQFEKSGNSREDYVRMREYLNFSQSLNPGPEMIKYPLKLDTLQLLVRSSLPLLRLMRKAVPVVILKQPSLPAKQKKHRQATTTIHRNSWLYWFDPVDLARAILSAPKLLEKAHFGMAEWVDEPIEFWQSRSWASSSIITSGHHAYATDGNMLIPGDVVRIDETKGWNMARIIGVGRDYRSSCQTKGDISILVQAVVGRADIPDVAISDELGYTDPRELWILQDLTFHIPPTRVRHVLDILLKRDVDEDHDHWADLEERFFIKSFITNGSVYPIRRMEPTRGELEIEHFGRDALEEFADTEDHPTRSLPFVLFIDDFGIYRNMYRASKAFYLIPACLPYTERRKIANVFTLCLGPHGANPQDIINALKGSMQSLATGLNMELNGHSTMVRGFTHVIVGDLPQQADNTGFLRHNANLGCRSCLIRKEERGDYDFDYIRYGRYHWDIMYTRQEAEPLSGVDKAAFFSSKGMRPQPASTVDLAPWLDLVLSRAYDIPHSEWRGMGRLLQGLLFQSILTDEGCKGYLKAFQSFPFPRGWPRLQSPLHYMWSWSLSEAGRATILAPLILRLCGRTGWYKVPFLHAAERHLNSDDQHDSAINAVIDVYRYVAELNTRLGSHQAADQRDVTDWVKGQRRLIHKLLQCAHDASLGGRRRPNDPGREVVADYMIDRVLEDEGETLNQPEDGDGQADTDINAGPSVQAPLAATPRMSQWQKAQRLPNFHVGLHLATNFAEYATAMNCNVLAGELKHKYFKRLADTAAPTNLMGYLMTRERVKQSVRLGFAGAWDFGYPDLRDTLNQINANCPSIIRSFIPLHEQDTAEDDEAEAEIFVM